MSTETIPPLESMTPQARAICLAWYQQGITDGIAMGRQQADDEHRGRWAVSAAIARQIAGRPEYADLAERRGQPERAARQRALLRERGVTP